MNIYEVSNKASSVLFTTEKLALKYMSELLQVKTLQLPASQNKLVSSLKTLI
jgi:hypothetical protein